MAQKVTIFNDNTHDLRENFKGEEMVILAKDYWRDKKGKIKELDIYEANDYRGQYAPVPFDGSGKMLNDPRYFKILKIEPVGGVKATHLEDEEPTGFKCMAESCKHVSPSEEELAAHTTVRHPNAQPLIMPEVDMEIRRNKGGRPKKEHTDLENTA